MLFNLGETIIVKDLEAAGTIVSIIPAGRNSLINLYIVEVNDVYHIFPEDNLLVYDKYYWDESEV